MSFACFEFWRLRRLFSSDRRVLSAALSAVLLVLTTVTANTAVTPSSRMRPITVAT